MGQKIGYIRVSSEEQNFARQQNQLQEIGIDLICKENLSGASKERPELQKMLSRLQKGDSIFVTDLIFDLIEIIREKEAYLKSLKDSWFDISENNPYSEFLITIMGGVNQLERPYKNEEERGNRAC